ncbi:DUF429 domain-containing protein [Halobacillus yeomjeoni]|uniref:DUF429 domain-containing protein n=1 Tax=Halobacillus yeomjeoni TaxID=311194 RepID=A0A931HV99_9BACI|nr:DUF429 domain-containing protein [Halobacillus yeomjeoni]MBH0230435.1 DUF429 domain-containing protein [Halobacillus yeomjeoni]
MNVIGIDLSGPSNHKDTVVTAFEAADNHLKLKKILRNASDHDIFSLVGELSPRGKVYIGIDAPLSYQDGGGDRPADKYLRAFSKALGMKSGSIMPPTLTRMVYLTMRGIHIAHSLQSCFGDQVAISEVHPGVALASRLDTDLRWHAMQYKKELDSRLYVLKWLAEKDVDLSSEIDAATSHELDACLAGLAAWHWASDNHSPKWSYPAYPPDHTFPFHC